MHAIEVLIDSGLTGSMRYTAEEPVQVSFEDHTWKTFNIQPKS